VCRSPASSLAATSARPWGGALNRPDIHSRSPQPECGAPTNTVRTLEPAGSFHFRNLRTSTLEEMVGANHRSLPNRSGPRAREHQQEGRNYTRNLAFRYPAAESSSVEQRFILSPTANRAQASAQAPFAPTSRRGRSSTRALAAPPVCQPYTARARVARRCAATGSIANP
jgi:hypothetical protein